MKRLWMWYFPLLFLPNLGVASGTGFGTIEFSDFLIVPYIVLLLVAADWTTPLNVGRLTPWMLAFIGWALISTATIPVRYEERTEYFLFFGMLKIAKICLYGYAGVLTARALTSPGARSAFDWSLLGAAVVNGLALWITQIGLGDDTSGDSGYSATNGISVMAALLLCYLGGRLVTGQGTAMWRAAAPWGLVILAGGAAVSDGRGGWVAALAGAVYIALRLGFRRQVVTYGLIGLVVIGALYQVQPEFRQQVDATLFAPETTSGYQGTRNVGTVDDGARFQTWGEEAIKIVSAPIQGSGMFHRGADTGLYSTGSHNFWLQMYLELGLVGGTLVITMVVVAWKQASRLRTDGRFADVPLKAALVAAMVGGLGGEYFYGGIILFTLLVVYAPTGGIAYQRTNAVLDVERRRSEADVAGLSAGVATGAT